MAFCKVVFQCLTPRSGMTATTENIHTFLKMIYKFYTLKPLNDLKQTNMR